MWRALVTTRRAPLACVTTHPDLPSSPPTTLPSEPLLYSTPPPSPRPLAARQVNPEAIPVRRLKSAIYHRATALRGETVHSVASVSIPAGKLMKWIYAMHFISLMMVSGYELRGDGEEVSEWVGGWCV